MYISSAGVRLVSQRDHHSKALLTHLGRCVRPTEAAKEVQEAMHCGSTVPQALYTLCAVASRALPWVELPPAAEAPVMPKALQASVQPAMGLWASWRASQAGPSGPGARIVRHSFSSSSSRWSWLPRLSQRAPLSMLRCCACHLHPGLRRPTKAWRSAREVSRAFGGERSKIQLERLLGVLPPLKHNVMKTRRRERRPAPLKGEPLPRFAGRRHSYGASVCCANLRRNPSCKLT